VDRLFIFTHPANHRTHPRNATAFSAFLTGAIIVEFFQTDLQEQISQSATHSPTENYFFVETTMEDYYSTK
jgi:hypothetical protein